MEHSNLTLAKIPILDTEKFKQWKFRIQQYLQNELYALWEVIDFGDSYEAPKVVVDIGSGSEGSAKKKGRTIAVTTKDMHKMRNDVKARTTLLLAIPDEHQLRFNKYKTAQELWAAILKTFGGNETTRKTKKNLLKQYGNGEVNTASISTASTQVSPASANVAAASINLNTVCAYIASQSNGSQIMYEDINQIDEDDIEEMDIKWNMALLSMRPDRYWKKTRKKISIQGTNVAGFDKLKTECFNCHKMCHFAMECRAPRSQDRGRRENYRQGSKEEEQAPKALMEIDEVGWDWSYMANEEENHALVADEEAPTEFALMAKSSSENEVFDNSLCSKACKKNTDSLNSKITDLSEKLSDSKTMLYNYKLGLSQVEARLVEFNNQEIKFCEKIRGLEFKVESKTNIIESLTNELEMLKKEKEGLDSKLTVLFPPPTQVYSPPKKDMSWTGLPEFADDTITDYSRPTPSIESNLNDLQNNSSSISENGESTSSILSKPEIKFVKAADSPTVIKTNKDETVKKTSVKYAEMYRKTSKSSNVERGKSRPKNNTHKSLPPKTVFYKSDRSTTRITRPNTNAAQPKRTSFYKPIHSYVSKPFQGKSAVRTQFRVPRVPTVNRKFPTVNKKFPTGNSKVSTTDLKNKGKAVKASACWIWKPKQNSTVKAFCNYHNMIAILKKYEHNANFHQIVDFVEASHLRIETTDEGTKILATVDGKPRTISKSSIRRNLKLKDEAGISSLPDAELFENLTLMGYNILPNQKFSFQKGQFSHQWKYLIHTIMQCLSPKSTGFNEFSSSIATALVCLATNRVYNFSKIIFNGMVLNVNNKVSKFLMYPRFLSKCLKMGQFGQVTHSHTYTVPFHTRKFFTTLRVNSPSFSGRTVPLFPTMLVTMGEGSGTPTEPHHTPSPEAPQSLPTATSSPTLLPVTSESFPTVIPTETLPLRQYTRRARIAQSSALPTAADKPASPFGDGSQGEACLTVSGLEVEQDRANIIKTSTLPHDSTPRVTSLAVDEGRRIKLLEDRDGGGDDPFGEDAIIKGRILRSMETEEEAVIERSTEKGSNDTEEMVNVLTFMDAASILSSAVQVSVLPAAEVTTVSVPPATISVPTGSDMVPTASLIFSLATVATPYLRRKEEELQMLIDGLDRNNEVIARHLHDYEQAAAELNIGEKIKFTNELVKYQDHYASILKYQGQQSKPLSKKQQREFYMSVLRSNAGWKTKHFKGMSLEEIREKFVLVWKQIEDFVPMGYKEEGERFNRKGLKLEQESAKKVKTSEEILEEYLKEMMHLVPVEEVYMEALQVKHLIIDWEIQTKGRESILWALVKETLNIRQALSNKEKELWVELKRLYEPDVEDQLWKQTQALMHDLVEWRLYDTCGVHHVLSRDQEIFMLVEKEYPLRKGLAIVMISNKLQVENYSQMANDLILKIHKIANSPRQRNPISREQQNIETIDPILEKFIDEPSLDYLPLPRDDDDDLFDLKFDNDEWKKILYGDCYKDIDSEKDKNKDSKMKSLVVEAHIVESNYLLLQLLDDDSTLLKEPSESSEIASLSSSPYGNKDKVFNSGILILGGTQIFNDESKDKDLRDKDLIPEDRNFLSISSDKYLMFLLDLTVIETLLSFSSKNKDKVFNPWILTSKGVHCLTLELSHRTDETFKIINIHLNIFNEGSMKIFPFFCFCPMDH
nr:hypothetical protein [Tanacetum cinerariifolium]